LNRKPEWLRIRVRNNGEISQVEDILQRLSLHTVCEEANCPNRMECFSRKTATFMILGRVCTRNCRFCNVEGGVPGPVDGDEPEHVADAVKELGLLHSVITSVTRDDLPDGGAGHFARTIRAIRDKCPGTVVEVLIPDFKGDNKALETVVEATPDIINHNVETVPRLYNSVRPQACYERSLQVLKSVKSMNDKIYTKSGIMVGLGESREEVIEVFKDLRDAGCDFLTVGQYLSPSEKHYPVREFVHPDMFGEYKRIALDMGFGYVASSPLVRSSYNASEALKKV
jgi:lipoic acid synthetase